MEPTPLSPVVRRLVRALSRNPHPSVPDADLLDRFVTQRDEAAFELLVWRHERLVRGVCRRLLRCEQDVEDAGQATFLTLACKAGSIGKRHALGGWLYKVAFRIALRLRAETVRRGRHEKGPAGLDAVPALDGEPDRDAARHDLFSVVDEEISRLPEKYRTPFILCYLEGKTNEEAASQLGCPTGTVVTWLARARSRLRTRLERRGVAVTAGGLAALAAQEDIVSSAPPAFLQPTVKAALLFARDRTAAGLVSPRVAQLTKGALHAMLMDRVKVAAVVLLVVCIAGARPGILAYEKLTPPALPANQQASPAPTPVAAPQEQVAAVPVATPEQRNQTRKAQERKGERATVQEVLTKSFQTGQAPNLVVEVFNGPIEIVADADGKVDAKVTKKSEARTEEEAKAGLKNVDVQMTQEKGAIHIHANRIDKTRPGQESVAAVLHVPAGAILDLRTSNGPVTVKGGKGTARVRTSNGGIQVKENKGALRLTTSNGSIDVAGATGRMELKTSNGGILVDAEAALVKAETSNHEIRFRGRLADGEHTFTTSNGQIRLTLPQDARFRVDARTSNGTIVDDFSPGRAKGRGVARVQHTVGDNPKASIRLRTSNGSIEIRKQQ
jgi:RNA polymerase sigma factor (sigma-70 family)